MSKIVYVHLAVEIDADEPYMKAAVISKLRTGICGHDNIEYLEKEFNMEFEKARRGECG